MALNSQVLDHSGWLSNPLRFNVIALVSVGVKEGEKRMSRQARSNVLPLPSRLLKRSVFSPARPPSAETRFSPDSVLASFRPRLASLRFRHEPPWIMRARLLALWILWDGGP